MTVHGKDIGEEIGGVDKARDKEDKADFFWLILSLIQSRRMSID